MDNHLEHVGVLGMRWGRRRGDSTPGHPDHERAVKNNTWLFQGSNRERTEARKRLRLEKVVKIVQARNFRADKTPVKTMSNDQINAFLKNPFMKKSIRDVKSADQENNQRKGKIIATALLAGYIGIRTGLASDIGKRALKSAIKIKNARRFVKEGANVVNGVWK